VNQDNTVVPGNRIFQLETTRWRNTLAGQTVVVHEHPDGRVSIRYGPHLIAQYASDQLPPQAPKRRGAPGRRSELLPEIVTAKLCLLEAPPPDLRDFTL
jgi:hypothetical protein